MRACHPHGMTLTITDTEITSDLTDARAEFRPDAAADGSGAWIVSTHSGRLPDRGRAFSCLLYTSDAADE